MALADEVAVVVVLARAFGLADMDVAARVVASHLQSVSNELEASMSLHAESRL